MKLRVRLEYFDKTSYFEQNIFFSNVSRKFSVSFTNTFKVNGWLFKLNLCVGEKIVTIWHTNLIICQEKRKKFDFER